MKIPPVLHRSIAERLPRIAKGLNDQGSADRVGIYKSGSFSAEIMAMYLPHTGLKVYMHEIETGGIRASVKTAWEIDLDTKGLRAARHKDYALSCDHKLPEYLPYQRDHSRFSFIYGGEPGEILARLILAAAESDPSYGESLATWHARRQISAANCFKRDAEEQATLFDRLRAAALLHDPLSVCGVVGFHRERDIALPVVALTLRSLGLSLWIANDFSSSAVTVESPKPLELDPQALGLDFSQKGRAGFHAFYLAGIPFHGDYAADRQQFSFRLTGRALPPVIETLIKAAK